MFIIVVISVILLIGITYLMFRLFDDDYFNR